MPASVADEDVVVRIDGDAGRITEIGEFGGAAVSASGATEWPGAGDGGDDSGDGVDTADSIVDVVGKEEIASGVNGDAAGVIEGCRGG